MSIRPLPDEVAAQIKSSTAIVSLTGVVLELLKNSFDAKACKIAVTVDFARGSCTVEDDGLGIAPAEFSEEGGLGKLYCTSKFHSDEPYLGQHGTFLASLSAVSLLTITSHHHAHRSQNSISFHHAQTIERQIPTPAQNHVFGKHGTRVTVRNLFGNMPVRVKQRTAVADQKTEQQRLRQTLKRETVGLLLSWRGSVVLKIRDNDNKTIVNFNTLNAAVTGLGQREATEKLPSAHSLSLLQIMTQAGYITVDEWASWVPASASTSAVTVKGAISLDPAPNKYAQFISFGLRPLSSETRGNELYEQVNRLFALSDFGTLQDDADVDEHEKLRRLSDKRYKNDGFTSRQLKVRKGVDRYPMFYLRISFKDSRASSVVEEQCLEDESSLQAVVAVFGAMITQWLSVHHFRPRKSPKVASTSSHGLNEQTYMSTRKRQASPETPKDPVATNIAKRRRPVTAAQEGVSAKSRPAAFADWSRIKSGRSSFFEPLNTAQKPRTVEHIQNLPRQSSTSTYDLPVLANESRNSAAFDVAPIAKGALGNAAPTAPAKTENITTGPDDKDETISWIDPSTNKTYLLNSRTGCLMPHRRPQTDLVASSPSLTTNKSLRMVSRPATVEPAKTPWLNNLLQTWDNPIFKPTEQNIQQMSLQDDLYRTNTCRPRYPPFDVKKTFNSAGSSPARLSKDALSKADVISQVDKKFVLVKMAGSSADRETQSTTDLLVLIDQHAADERIQVESLLDDLCSPVHSSTHSSYRSKLGLSSPVDSVVLEKALQFGISPHEHTHFETFATNFAVWGILYDLSSSIPNNRETNRIETANKLSVTALPPSISERCKSDPQLLIGFLRSAVWQYVDSPPLVPVIPGDQPISWIKRIATCPPGLVDMVNSRACRSAIMFNDELSLLDCKTLISKLADCIFPFMCAHGRPSMVPIIDMGKVENAGLPGGLGETDSEDKFVDAWKKWKR